MNFVIKNIGIILCCDYYYVKLLKLKITKIQIYELILFAFLISILSCVLKNVNGYIVFPIFAITIYLFDVLVTKTDKITNFIVFIISLAISYMLFVLSVVVVSVFFYKNKETQIDYGQVAACLMQLLIMQLPFFVKRTKGGIPIFKNKSENIPIIIVSIVVISLIPFVNSGSLIIIKMIAIIGVLLFTIIFFIYWRTSITRHYLERLSLRNIDSLNDELDEKNEYIKRLLEDKERLEKLNHKNYKLIPALQGAVMHYLEGVSTFIEINADNPALAELAAAQEINMKEFITEGNRLMNDIKELQSEWKEMVDSDDIEGIKEVPKCGVTRVDYLLSYTYERSKKENFSFRADVDSDLSGITEKIISEADLATLIADLIENAIIATKYNDGKDILVRMGIMKKEYVIEIYDSGVKFDKDVLLKYGVEKITTHADDNGSGIGMMQTYEILNNCGASIYIDELSDKSGLFTKRISIVFNKKNQYVLYTKRDDDEVAYLHKRSDLLIIKK